MLFLETPQMIENNLLLYRSKFFISSRKQIEEISNNIQEARRIFEQLESDTRRLALVC